jgi:hypothetical protein
MSDRPPSAVWREALRGATPLPAEPTSRGSVQIPSVEQLIKDAEFRRDLQEKVSLYRRDPCDRRFIHSELHHLVRIVHEAYKSAESDLPISTREAMLALGGEIIGVLDASKALRERARPLLLEAAHALERRAERGIEPDAPTLEQLRLSTRTYNRLRKSGFQTIGDVLLADARDDLPDSYRTELEIGVGPVATREVRQQLAAAGWRR